MRDGIPPLLTLNVDILLQKYSIRIFPNRIDGIYPYGFSLVRPFIMAFFILPTRQHID